MQRIDTSLPGVYFLEPKVWEDARGFFFESYHQEKYAALGIGQCFVQDNHSKSGRGTLRGLHYQIERPQSKLCRVVQGEVLDVAVDIRRGSPTFGQWVSARLSAENKRQIFVPRGFAHGFVVLSETAEFLYKCDELYYPELERGIAWDDPAIGVAWELEQTPTLSQKDQRNPRLADADPGDLPSYTPGP